ncbi:MAG: flippase-like domain-containing protein [Clostridia bacterium]|nr:flippase-like domain-containing protein [Clostridia bacterium]
MDEKDSELNINQEEVEAVNDAPTEAAEPAPESVPENAPEVKTEVTVKEVKDEAVAEPAKKKRGVRIFWNVFLVVVIALGILSLFGIVGEIGDDNGASLGEVLSNASPLFCVILVLVVLLTMVLDVSKFCIICKTVTGKFRLATAAKTNFLGRYYDAVTPFSTGGQPMQIYYLNTKGISGGNSSAIVLIRYFSSILCWIILGGALMIAGTVQGVLDGVSGGSILKITGWIGIGVNLIMPAFVTLFLVLPKLMQKLTVGFVKLGHKMKIVKDVDKTTARATKVVSDFKNSFKVMATSPLYLILLLLVCFAESALTFAIPYFVMKAFNCQVDGMLLSIMSLNVFAIFGVSFIPTPGNSGVVEGMGALAFSVAAGSSLVWSVITWRLSVFYIFILIGLVITIYDIIKKNTKGKKGIKTKE